MHIKTIRQIIKISPAYNAIKASKKLVLPGFEGLSFYIVSKFFFQGLKNGSLNMRATSLAFTFFLAIFPSIIFLFTLIPYIPIDNFQGYLFNLLQQLMPEAAFETVEDTIIDIIKKPRSGLLSFGFLSALYFASNGFNALMNSFNETYHQIEVRNPLQQRLASLVMLFVNFILLSAGITLIIGGEIGTKYLFESDKVLYYLLFFAKWIILFGLCYSLISFNYYYGPKNKKGWRFFSAGSMFATVLIIVASLAFAYYVNNFGKYNKLYGSIGTLIVIMMWIYINSLIILLGFDLNASIHSAKKHLLKK
jgi:membrane protein